MVKALAAPYGHTGVRFVPTGGVTADKVDLLFVVDNSGSMTQSVSTTSQATSVVTNATVKQNLRDNAYTLIGQSPVFVNTAATYPAGTWVNVACPDIPYTGPFYALIDYYVPSSPIKNYLGFDGVTPQTGYPNGLAWVNASGVFSSAVSAFGGAYGSLMTWLMRANVCVSGKDKDAPITTIDPASIPMTQPVTPNLAAAANLGATGSVDAGQPSVHSPSAPADGDA